MVAAVGCAVTSDPTVGGAVAEPVIVRRSTDQEGQRLQQIGRRAAPASDVFTHPHEWPCRRGAQGDARTGRGRSPERMTRMACSGR
ncbi:hypothetical protein AV521_40755 [Streptomyces sp. IMTB 2501]|nr:hypothetical protein AV521_40755 [Streptomyces sp. IMTB 2501]